MTLKRWFLAAAGPLVLGAPAHATATPSFNVTLILQPKTSSFAVSLDATGLTCAGTKARLYLNRALTITAATVDDRPVQPELDPAGAPAFWISRDRAIDLPCPAEHLHLDYRGRGDQLTSDGRNQVTPALVELSLYGGWYPLQAIDVLPNWSLATRLPPGWHWASNGHSVGNGIIKLRSSEPADIAMVGAPRLAEAVVRSGAVRARLLFAASAMPADRATMLRIGAAGADMARWLAGILGPAKGARRPVIVVPPRGGSPSYARLPLVVLSRDSLAPDRDRPPRLNIRHEIAHFWSTAPASADQWITEGTAEYLAVKRMVAVEGQAKRRSLLASYRAAIVKAGPSAIRDNAESDGPAGFAARYARPVLLFDQLERRRGWSRVQVLLRSAYASGERLTTARFLDLTERKLGSADRRLVDRCLAAPDLPAECGGADD